MCSTAATTAKSGKTFHQETQVAKKQSTKQAMNRAFHLAFPYSRLTLRFTFSVKLCLQQHKV